MRNLLVLMFCAAIATFAFVFSRLLPPDHMSIAAGPSGGAYYATAEKFARILARDGIRLTILETEGSVDNAAILAKGGADAALVQSGIGLPQESTEAIGALYFEPMLFIVKVGANIPRNPAKWKGLRINSGAPGSGTDAAFRDFERVVGINPSDNIHEKIPYDEAIAALKGGDLDIAVFVAPLDAPYLVESYGAGALQTLDLDNSDAISRRLTYASLATVPSGALMLDPVIPREPRNVIALKARLVVDANIHPALVDRLTMAAIELHSRRGLIADAGTFPAITGTDLPVNNIARSLIQEGPSAWHDWLPYWLAAQISRVFLLFLPFLFIVLPILRLMPTAYAYVMRRRVWRHYPEIRFIEEELARDSDDVDLDAVERRMSQLEARISSMLLPAAYRKAQYDARLHLQLVQMRVAARKRERSQADRPGAA